MKKLTRRGMPYRRKVEGKTDYKSRLEMLKSGRIRLVIRRSLKNVLIQFVEFHPDGDKIVSSTCSQELAKKYNLKGSLKNIPTSYLTGLLAAKKASDLKIKEVVPDLGIRKPHTGGAVFSALRGILDAGIKISHKESSDAQSVFPTEERLKGDHVKVKNNYEEIKSKILN